MIDIYDPHPRTGWPQWMLEQIGESHFVVCVCTKTYCERFENQKPFDEGRGARFEGNVITNEIYQKACQQEKFIPVLFEGASPEDIPSILQSLTRYRLSEQYEALYARLTAQKLHYKEPLGKIRRIDPKGPGFPGAATPVSNANEWEACYPRIFPDGACRRQPAQPASAA